MKVVSVYQDIDMVEVTEGVIEIFSMVAELKNQYSFETPSKLKYMLTLI